MSTTGSSSSGNQICLCGIAHGVEPIAEYGLDSNNRYQALLHVVLEKVQEDDDKKRTFTHEDMCVHYVTRPSNASYPEGVTYFVVAKNSVSRRMCFMLLYEMEQGFLRDHVSLLSSPETIGKFSGESGESGGGANHEAVVKMLEQLMTLAVNNDTDAFGMAKKEIEEVKHIMVENVERLLERGERIHMLVTKTDRMNNNATAFRRRTVQVRRRLWMDNVKYTVALIVVGLLFIYLLLAFVCGVFLTRCRA